MSAVQGAGATAPAVNAKPTGFFGMFFGTGSPKTNTKNVESVAAGAKHNVVNVKPANATATNTGSANATATNTGSANVKAPNSTNSQTVVNMEGGRRSRKANKSKSKKSKKSKSKKSKKSKKSNNRK